MSMYSSVAIINFRILLSENEISYNLSSSYGTERYLLRSVIFVKTITFFVVIVVAIYYSALEWTVIIVLLFSSLLFQFSVVVFISVDFQ